MGRIMTRKRECYGWEKGRFKAGKGEGYGYEKGVGFGREKGDC